MSNPIPQGKYKPAVRKGNLIFTAGMTPRLNGQLIMSGKVESGVSVEDYRQAADQATANALNAALSCVQPGEKITQILSLTVYINAAPTLLPTPKSATWFPTISMRSWATPA